jgi:hypothetical protein
VGSRVEIERNDSDGNNLGLSKNRAWRIKLKHPHRLPNQRGCSLSKPKLSIPMSNIQIESDLKEVLGEINSKIGKIDSKIDKIDDRLKNIEVSQARLEEKFNSQEKIVTELKGSQDKQIWALIVLAFTAVVSLLIGLGKFIFFPNP